MTSFINAIDTLELRASEQIDLLVKSLGPESTKHAPRIKAVNITNPAVALELIWERLEETYGSPEAIESALFTKLDQFPKIGPRDNQKLRELSDLLQEINAAKQEGYLHGLSYLDTARGVAAIVDKLPYGIQDKWMMEGSHYKQRHRVTFPPFTFFLQFIQTQAKARNDPSFNLLSTCNSGVKRDKLGDGYSNNRRSVSVHKTNVIAISEEGPDKCCPVYNKPHALQQCRSFREKPIQERKAILKQHNICFKCCASNKHVARDCQAEIKCSECNSDKHPTALHSDVPRLPKALQPPASHGGGDQELKKTAVV
ncbi:uncharacterized protein LOC121813867, partial [Haplochromis burtoni]|uniref:uncharacterized protein LOC121813867 n=1 Tax=Haplochromis burtoni TaxID=8153 RepID=UPI001C2DD980